MNEVFADYPVQDLIMNSDMTRVNQSMTPKTTLCQAGMPADIGTGVFTNSVAGAMCTFTTAGSILPIWFAIPTPQTSKFSITNNETGQRVYQPRKKQTHFIMHYIV